MVLQPVASVLIELYKWLRLILWLFQYLLMCVFYRLLRFKNFDDVLDAIAEDVEHKHPVEEDMIWGRGRKKTVRPKTFHQRDVKLEPVEIFYPKTKEELQLCILNNERFRAIGSGHSFRGVVETDGVLISIEDMNKVLSVEGSTVIIEAGIKIRDAIRILEKENLALRNMGNYDRQSLGGAICGGTHGTSGQGKTDTFTSSILSLKMINAKGEDCVLTPEQSVNFGLGGVIYEVTMSLEPFYYLEQNCYNVDPSTIDLNKWWESGAQFIMARWTFPGRDCEVCQIVEFKEKTFEEGYEKDRSTALWDRFYRVFLFRAAPFLPKLIHKATPRFFGDTTFVDKYYLQYVDDPAPHHTEWEYAVPYNNANDITPLIRGAVEHIKYSVEVHIRSSPRDKAKAHLAHRGDVIWFNLNVVTPKRLSEAELNEVAKPFETLCVSQGGVAHPHKLVVDIKNAGLPAETIEFLTAFQSEHDPDKKMINPALAAMLNQPPPSALDDDDLSSLC